MTILQRILTNGFYVITGAAVLASLFGYIGDLGPINTPRLALIGSAVIVVIWLGLELSIKYFRFKWKTEIGHIQLQRLGKMPRLAMVGAILILWVNPVVNLFRVPSEVSTLPHVLYDYASNYPVKFFRVKELKAPLAGDLFSKLSLYNNSSFLLENVVIKIYGFCTGDDITNFMKPYYLDESSYLLIGFRTFTRIEEKKTVVIDLIEPLKEVFKANEHLNNFILPEPGQSVALPRLPCVKHEISPLFTNDEKLLQEAYIPIVPSNVHMGREAVYGFNGAMLKITLEYVVNGINFMHLLVGGMFYKYIITTEIPVPYREGPVGVAVSGFYKAPITLWKKKDDKSYTHISVPQDVADTIEEGQFLSKVGGPFQPGNEIWLRIAPGALTSPAGELLPLPMYLYVQNNIRTPQR
jgi:hypothetical protein